MSKDKGTEYVKKNAVDPMDGRKKRRAKRLCVTNVTRLLLSGLLQKDLFKVCEVWGKVVSNKIIVSLVTQGLPLPSCCVSSLMRRSRTVQ